MRRLLAIAALAGALIITAALAAAWLLGTESGLRWALARAVAASQHRLAVEDASGALAGEVHFGRLAYRGEGFALELQEVQGRVHLLAALAGRLALEPLRAASLRVELAEKSPPRSGPLSLAFGFAIADAEIGALEVQRGASRYTLRLVRIERASLDKAALSASASFQVADERLPASVGVEVDGSLEKARIALTAREGTIAVDARAVVSTAGEGLRGTLSMRNARPGPIDRGRLPIASLDTTFASPDLANLRLASLRIALAGGGVLEGGAEASLERVQARLQAKSIDLRALQTTLRSTSLHGPLQIELTRDAQSLEARLEQEGVRLAAQAVRRGAVLEIRRLQATAAGGEVSGTGRVQLEDAFPFRAELNLSHFDPAAFGDYPTGTVSGKVSAAGRLDGEREIDARWSLAESTLQGLPLDSTGSARFSAHRVTRAQATLRLGEAQATVQGAFGRPGDQLAWTLVAPRLEQLDARLAGHLKADGMLGGAWEHPQGRIDASVEELRIRGGPALEYLAVRLSGGLGHHEAELALLAPEIDLRAELSGAWSGSEWSGELRSAVNGGRYPLRLLAPTPLRIARQRVEIGRLEASLDEGRLLLRALRWTPQEFASSGDFERLPAYLLLLAAGLSERAQGDLMLDGEWSLAAAPRLDGSLRVRRAGGDLELLGETTTELGLQEALLEARFVKSRATVSSRVASRFGNLELDGEIAPAAQAAGLAIDSSSTIALQGRMAFASLRTLATTWLAEGRLDGTLKAELQVRGTLGEPLVQAQLLGSALAVELPPYGVYLKNGELRAALEGDQLRIDSFTIQGGDGQFSASGAVPLRLADGGARVIWRAERFTVVDRPELRLIASGEGSAHFDGSRLALQGDLRADRGVIQWAADRLPRLGDDIWVAGRPPPGAGQRQRLPVELDIHLDLGDNLEVHAQGLDGKLTGHVDFATTKDGELRAYGKVQTLNATFFAYGQKLQVDPGIVVFDGPIDNPGLQVTAWRRNQAVEAGVQLSGTMRVPLLQIVSQPPVPEGERLSWLVLGRAPSDANKADLGMLQAAAGALLARGESVPLDRKIARSFGVDEISLRGTGEAQDRVVAVGKRISDRVYISYEQGIGSIPSNLVKMDYSLSRRWLLRAETGTSSGGGVFYRFSWD